MAIHTTSQLNARVISIENFWKFCLEMDNSTEFTIPWLLSSFIFDHKRGQLELQLWKKLLKHFYIIIIILN